MIKDDDISLLFPTATKKKLRNEVFHTFSLIYAAGRKLENYIRAYISHLPNALRRHFFLPARRTHITLTDSGALPSALRGRREGLKNYTPFFPLSPPSTVNGAGRNIAFGEDPYFSLPPFPLAPPLPKPI